MTNTSLFLMSTFMGILTLIVNNWQVWFAVLGMIAAVFQYLKKGKALQLTTALTYVIQKYHADHPELDIKGAVATVTKPAGLNELLEDVLDAGVRKEISPAAAPSK